MNDQEIPRAFYSFETNAPFERCIECEKYLLDDDTEYLIEKAIKNYRGFEAQDVVFDYAICMDCAEEMRRQISRESWAQMMKYFQANMNLEDRLAMQNKLPEENLKQCLIKKTPAQSCGEYQIYAHCKGRYLNPINPPYLISGAVMEELLPLLSDKTIDEMNGFMSRHFAPDPSLMEPTPPSLILL